MEHSTEQQTILCHVADMLHHFVCQLPDHWGVKLQTEIALSTNKSEYITLFQSLHDVIPLIELLRQRIVLFQAELINPIIHYTVHEDNKGCIDLVETPACNLVQSTSR